jgi:hypothetical protein
MICEASFYLWIFWRTSGKADEVSKAHALALLLATVEKPLPLNKILMIITKERRLLSAFIQKAFTWQEHRRIVGVIYGTRRINGEDPSPPLS